jgi:dipeptidyl aminopeptidase/acylaminoacyl peptidase
VAALFLPLVLAQTARRPLTHQDYDAWRTISNQRLSPDGKFLTYAVFPQEGDSEVVIRNLGTGEEKREPAGERPAPPPPNPLAGPEEGPPQARGVTMAFTSDNRFLVFSTFPARAESDKAKKENKSAEDGPKGGMVIWNLATGSPVRVARVKSFQVPAKGGAWLAYHSEPPEKPAEAKKEEAPKQEQDADQSRRGGSSRSAAASGAGRRPEFGSHMVLRELAGGAERTFPDVVEYFLAEDAKDLVFAVSSRETEKNGVFAARPGTADAPAALLAGKGKYEKLAADEKQTRLAFLSDKDGQDSKPAKFRIYLWARGAAPAVELVSTATPGFRQEYVVSESANLAFSRDGARLFFGCAPPAPPRPAPAASAASADKPGFDLWHWKDDYIQPMQKVRAERDRNRSFTAVYRIADKKLVQLADPAMADVTPTESAAYALGADDRQYRRMVEYDERFTDTYAVNLETGARQLLARKHRGSPVVSPGGRAALLFDGQHWNLLAIPGGASVNLTASLGVNFWNEENDRPETPGPYSPALWTRDGASALVYDRYDVWQLAGDGSGARCLTAGYGRRNKLQFRVVRQEEDPRDRWIDPAKPLLLRAENQETHETGFFRAHLGASAPPRKLLFAAKDFGVPVKAKDADVWVLTAQSFTQFPDLYVTGADFKELRQASRVGAQKDAFAWGTAELLPYKNVDGVPLQAALYKPDNFDARKKYPLLVYIYERLSQNVNRFVDPRPMHSINFSYYVSNGYLVLTPDIVYKTGFPGQSALQCVLPAIQALVDRGFVDENAIGIQGHSWGGYQIAYMVTQTNRFRAVAAGAPVSNMTSAYDGIRWGPGLPRQFQYERQQSRIGGSLWQYPTRFIENSPIFMADRVRTPVMMLHNDADDAVPWYQGIEYFLALRRLGKEVYMFTYNGEPHGIRRRPNQKDYAMRLQQYFDHYLKGAPRPAWMDKGIPYIEK